jgi:hypothetical protein
MSKNAPPPLYTQDFGPFTPKNHTNGTIEHEQKHNLKMKIVINEHFYWND